MIILNTDHGPKYAGTCEACIPSVIVIEGDPFNLDIPLQTCMLLGGEFYCPKCLKSDQIIPIVYGYPTKKTLERSGKNEIHLGGCMISECNPEFFCKRDSTAFKL